MMFMFSLYQVILLHTCNVGCMLQIISYKLKLNKDHSITFLKVLSN